MTTSLALNRMYSYFQILSLPFKFFASELFMWNRAQLAWCAKTHRVLMLVIVMTAAYMLGDGLVAQYRYDIREEQRIQALQRVIQAEKEIDRQGSRLDKVEQQVVDINLQIARFASGLDALTGNMRTGMSILGAIGLVILGQFATYVFNMKMRREYGRIEKREGH